MSTSFAVTRNKWKPLLEHKDLKPINDPHRRDVVAQLLENTEKALDSGDTWSPRTLLEAAPNNNTGNVDTYDPVLISLVRRALPNLIAYDICGVQSMTGPTGLIFALRAHYTDKDGEEAFYNEANTGFATVTGGNNEIVGDADGNLGEGAPTGNSETYNFGSGMSTATAEALGAPEAFREMAITVDKVQVLAKSRALKAEYSMELAQDLKAIHGLDAETELANILSAEVLAEINREIIRTINLTAKAGAQSNVALPGTFNLDLDSNGRWMAEKFKGILFQLERECNAIAKGTRRGRGNLVVTSSDVASALSMAGVLDYAPAINSNLTVDDTGNTFAGLIGGRIKCYIDPYATTDYFTAGYKGESPFDAGLFYAPYVPLQMVRAIGQDTFQPKIGFKTRYGVVANPFSKGAVASDGSLAQNSNVYYRRVLVTNLM